jgi:hypothetical protein
MTRRLFYLVMGCLAFIMTLHFGTALSDFIFQTLALL